MKITDCIFLGIILALITFTIIKCSRDSKKECSSDMCTLESIKFNNAIKKIP